MRKNTLQHLVCVANFDGHVCQTALESLDLLPDPSRPEEIKEGWLVCPECGAKYPILCGLVVLVNGVSAYLQKNYAAITQIAVENDIHFRSAMRDYLHELGAHLDRGHAAGEDTPRALSTYISAHYDDRSPLQERLPAEHPLAVFLATYRQRDVYQALYSMLLPHLVSDNIVLDVGCHVGRIVRDFSSMGAHVYGVELAFSAAFTARRALLGWPTPLDSYEYFRDVWQRETRSLNLPPFSQGDILIASGSELPFAPDFFDAISCVNVVDIVPNPIILLKELRRVLKDGALLGLSTPYHTGAANAARQWLGENRKMSASQALRWRIGHLFDITAEEDDVPWVVGEHERRLTVYLNHCMVGRKSQPTKTT